MQHVSFAVSFPVRLNVDLLVTFIYSNTALFQIARRLQYISVKKCDVRNNICQIDDVRDTVFEEARAAYR